MQDLLLQANTGGGGAGETAVYNVLKQVVMYASYGSRALLIIIGTGAVFFAIWVAFAFFRANDESKRRNAKNQLIYSIVGIICILAMVSLLQMVLVDPQLANPFKGGGNKSVEAMQKQTMSMAYLNLYMVVECVCLAIYPVATVFAVWVAWTMLSATDEGKLKNARWHMIYVVIGVLAVVFIHTVLKTAFK